MTGAFSQADYRRAIEAFAAAPFDAAHWTEGLDLFGRAGGGWAGHLIGVSAEEGLVFNWASGFSEDAMASFEAYDAAAAAINPRLARAVQSSVGEILADDHCLDAIRRARSPIYQELFNPFDAAFAAVARLPDIGGAKVLVSVLRSKRQGHSQRDDHRRMARLLPHISAALKLQANLEGDGARLAAASLEALSIAAFFLSRQGRTVAMTTAAERLVESPEVGLFLKRGVLGLADQRLNSQFQAAVRRAALSSDRRGDKPGLGFLPLVDASGRVRRLSIAPLPMRDRSLAMEAGVVVTVGSGHPRAGAVQLLRQAYALTPAEAEVALEVADGWSAVEISERRGAGVVTVRSQIQTALEKTGLRKASGLAAMVARLTA